MPAYTNVAHIMLVARWSECIFPSAYSQVATTIWLVYSTIAIVNHISLNRDTPTNEACFGISRHFGNKKKSLVCKLLKEEVQLYIFLRRCELTLSITRHARYKSTPALYGEIQSTNDFSLRRRLSGNANYYSFNSRLDSFEFGHLLKSLFHCSERVLYN